MTNNSNNINNGSDNNNKSNPFDKKGEDVAADENNKNITHETSEPEKKVNNKVGKKKALKAFDYLNNNSHNAKKNRQ